MFDVVKFISELHDYIGRTVGPIVGRIKALEDRQPEKGDKGDRGLDGDKGIRGDTGDKGDKGDRGDKGENGKDADPIEISDIVKELIVMPELRPVLALLVAEAVTEHLMENPVRDGKDGEKGLKGDTGDRGDSGKDGRDGLDVRDLFRADGGRLIAVMSNGSTKDLGEYVGKDGNDGRNGVDGKDGIGLDAFEMSYLAETHEIELKASAAGRTKELRYPAGGIRHGGFWNEGRKYLAGQVATHDGHAWIALRETSAKPCYENSLDWNLFVRKGRDGRDGNDGKPPVTVKLGTEGPQ